MEPKEKPNPSKALKVLLFWSNWIFLILLSNILLANPAGKPNIGFKAIATLCIALAVTGSMLHFFSATVIRITIVLLFISALILTTI